MRVAPSVKIDKWLIEALELRLVEYVRDVLFSQLFDVVKEDLDFLNDSPSLIIKAIRSGKIYFDGKKFKAKDSFGSRLAKEFKAIGAKFKNGGYVLPDKKGDKVIAQIMSEVVVQQSKADQKRQKILSVLDDNKKFPPPDCRKEIEDIVSIVSENVIKSLGVEHRLSAYTKNRLVDEYVNNTEKYSVKLLNKTNRELKKFMVDEVLQHNYTTETLANIITERFGIAARHATFIARQESHLAREKINQVTAGELGFRHYVWQTVGDYRVRPAGGGSAPNNHRILNGKIFSFDDPPVVDTIGDRKCNPGEDFGCRCTARVIIDDRYFNK